MARVTSRIQRSTASPIYSYTSDIIEKFKTGKATEHTYRGALQSYIEDLFNNIQAVNEPKRVKCGAPDYIVSKGQIPIGYIEAKDIGENLDKIEKSDQLKRYFTSLSNLILTDYLEFRWYVNGSIRLTASIGKIVNGKIQINENEISKLENLLTSFIQADVPTICTASELAIRLAGTTRSICGLIEEAYAHEESDGWLHKWLKAFSDVLISDLKVNQFADMFAQTLAHGLFAAKIHHDGKAEFSRFAAAKILPKTNPFLRKLFAEFVGVDMPDTINWAVDEIVELLKRTDSSKILNDFGKQNGRADPIIHFYEPFLHHYNPELKQRRGVYYTPSQVVNYITKSVDYLLKSEFEKEDGLADDETVILDPAVGTGSFLHKVVDEIYKKFEGNEGAWDSYVKENLLNRVFGFEILMAPYSVAHLNLGLQLSKSGYKFGKEQRLGIFLTNTLEESARKTELLLFEWISQEANSAATVKKDKPIMVVLGNPPYSIKSQNNGDWIENLLKDYKRGVDDGKLNLDDDFIKFIKFAQWRIQETGHGILAYITNNTFLDGMNHRRMRESLLETFSDIYVLNLHGSVSKGSGSGNKKEDENVFDIQQGVSITFFVRKPNHKGYGNVYYSDLVGLQDFKYSFLDENTVKTTKWTKINPVADRFFFVPKDLSKKDEYDNFWSVEQIFKIGSSGTQTKRDSIFVDVDKNVLEQRMIKLLKEGPTAENKELYDLEETSGWGPSCLKGKKFEKSKVRNYSFRPYDSRWVYYDDDLLGRSRQNVLKHMLKPNLALITLRQTVDDHFRHAFCSDGLVDINMLIGHHVSDQVFPLYIYNDAEDDGEGIGLTGKVPNFSSDFILAVEKSISLSFVYDKKVSSPENEFNAEELFTYIYAYLNSDLYRERFDELLKIGFPKVPTPIDKKHFKKLSEIGSRLIKIHIFKQSGLSSGGPKFPVKGSNSISSNEYDSEEEKLWINDEQYFTSITDNVWTYKVGGYQVLQKWIKDRKGKTLSYDSISHFSKVVLSIEESKKIIKEIDACINKAGGFPLKGLIAPPKKLATKNETKSTKGSENKVTTSKRKKTAA